MPKRSPLEPIRTLVLLVLLLPGCGSPDLESQWEIYKQRFIQQGRVVDTGNDGVSHSEGQGYAMLLAVAADDRETFEALWRWTREHLQVRSDHLFMWRRRPGVPLAKEDPNNATDGDLLIAWALLEADDHWDEPRWTREARSILTDLKHTVLRRWQDYTVLLPGAYGFEHDDRLVLNLSYWVFPALQRFAEADADPVWQRLIDSGLRLLEQARFGTWRLPSDWVEAAQILRPAAGRPPRFGYDAVRIPLYLVWGGFDEPSYLEPFLKFWNAFSGFLPPWVDLENNCIGAYPAPRHVAAIRALTQYAAGDAWWLTLPDLGDERDYYAATLTLLSHLAARQSL